MLCFPAASRVFLALCGAVCVLFAPAPAHAQPDASAPVLTPVNPLGVIEGFWLADEACALGASWERIIFDWAEHQPDGPESWNTLNVDERWLRAAATCGREVVAVVKHTPAWATDGTPGIGVPRGLERAPDDPANLWGAFMARAAAHYAPFGVNRFIIWNEPDIPAGTFGYEFEGTLEAYARLVVVASVAAKAANPDAQIHLAGVTYWHDVNAGRRLYLDRLLERLAAEPGAAEHGGYFDVATLHIYFRTETVYAITRETRALLDRHGFTRQRIWIGETNASPNRDPAWPVVRPNWQVTLEQQAAFLVHAAALGLAAGADHIGAYKLNDWNLAPGGESFGLIRPDGTRRPAFTTWAMLGPLLTGITDARLFTSGGVEGVRLRRSDGVTVWVLWARTAEGALVQVEAAAPVRVRDAFGAAVTADPAGLVSLFLAGASCNRRDGCAVGGAPLIVEGAPGDALDLVYHVGAGEDAAIALAPLGEPHDGTLRGTAAP